ncbi:hypothetical protein, partial [Streptomyces sp. NPDC002540]
RFSLEGPLFNVGAWPSADTATPHELVKSMSTALKTVTAVAHVTGQVVARQTVSGYLRDGKGPGPAHEGPFRVEYEALRLKLLRLSGLGESSFNAQEWINERAALREATDGITAEFATDDPKLQVEEWPPVDEATPHELVKRMSTALQTGAAVAQVTGGVVAEATVSRYLRDGRGPGPEHEGPFRVEYEALRQELLRLSELGESSFNAQEWIERRVALREEAAGVTVRFSLEGPLFNVGAWPSADTATPHELVKSMSTVLKTGAAVARVTKVVSVSMVNNYLRSGRRPGPAHEGPFRVEYEALRQELLRLSELGKSSFNAQEWINERAALREKASSGAVLPTAGDSPGLFDMSTDDLPIHGLALESDGIVDGGVAEGGLAAQRNLDGYFQSRVSSDEVWQYGRQTDEPAQGSQRLGAYGSEGTGHTEGLEQRELIELTDFPDEFTMNLDAAPVVTDDRAGELGQGPDLNGAPGAGATVNSPDTRDVLDSEAVLNIRVQQHHVKGMQHTKPISWVLAADAKVPLGELALSREDLAKLLSKFPELRPGGAAGATTG